MFDPRKKHHQLLGRLAFRLPPVRRAWQECLVRHKPILEPALPNNAAARLLVMHVLRPYDRGQVPVRKKTFYLLEEIIQDTTDADRALVCFLLGYGYLIAGDREQMHYWFNRACKYGHSHSFIHEMLALYYHDTAQFSPAEQHYLAAIDAMYAHPPVTDVMQRIIGNNYTSIAVVRTLMHRYDDAADALHLAEQMNANENLLLHSQAFHLAALHDRDASEDCLRRLEARTADQPSAADLIQEVRLILEDKHPHFTRMPFASPEIYAAYWQAFLKKEGKIRRMIDEKKQHDAGRLMMEISSSVQDPYKQDHWGFRAGMKDGEYKLLFYDLHSRTYAPFLDALAAACPEEVRARWTIVRKAD